MCDVLLPIYDAYTNINNYHLLTVLSCARLCVKHFANLFNPQENPLGIFTFILQIRSLLPSEVNKYPAQGFRKVELVSLSHLLETPKPVPSIVVPILGPERDAFV